MLRPKKGGARKAALCALVTARIQPGSTESWAEPSCPFPTYPRMPLERCSTISWIWQYTTLLQDPHRCHGMHRACGIINSSRAHTPGFTSVQRVGTVPSALLCCPLCDSEGQLILSDSTRQNMKVKPCALSLSAFQICLFLISSLMAVNIGSQ